MKHRLLTPALALLCLALATAAAAAPANAAAPAATFDAPGQRHAVQCVLLAASPAGLRYGDGSSTGFAVTNALSFDDHSCPAGTVRLDLHELIPSTQGLLAFHRGGNGYADDDNVKYGELAVADIAGALPAAVPSSGGRGAACEPSAEPDYRVSVRSIPSEMHYKRPQDVPGGSNSGASFMHYGDPGADQGDNHSIHYSYLLWSFVDVRGGGMVRTLLKQDQVVHPCDVQPVTMSAWDRDGNVNGQVTARYVRAFAGNCTLYGWMVWSHTLSGDRLGAVAHARAATAAPAPAPTADPACPVSAPAAAPDVVTGDPALGLDGAWALAGSVDPRGVPVSYRFDIGPGSDYGSSTPEVALAASDGPVPVSAPAGALALGTTYHYRLVASSTHGTTLGPDRVLVTPPPPPPPSPAIERTQTAAPLPPAPRPSLSGLRVAPGAFKRARTRHGAPARIRYRLSGPAAVRLSFQRRRGGRWVHVPGTVVRKASLTRGGSASVRFGGWIGHRRLQRGRYRLRAVPTSKGGGAGTAKTATFRLR